MILLLSCRRRRQGQHDQYVINDSNFIFYRNIYILGPPRPEILLKPCQARTKLQASTTDLFFRSHHVTMATSFSHHRVLPPHSRTTSCTTLFSLSILLPDLYTCIREVAVSCICVRWMQVSVCVMHLHVLHCRWMRVLMHTWVCLCTCECVFECVCVWGSIRQWSNWRQFYNLSFDCPCPDWWVHLP